MILISEDNKISDLENITDFKILQIIDKIEQLSTTSKQIYGKINDELEKPLDVTHQVSRL